MSWAFFCRMNPFKYRRWLVFTGRDPSFHSFAAVTVAFFAQR